MNQKHRESGKLLLGFLKQIAKEKGISIEEISRKSGFIADNVYRMFSGRYMPTLDNFIRLGEAIGIRLELHADSVDSLSTKTRNIDIPRFLLCPDRAENKLYIIHTHYPACLIYVVQTTQVSFQVIQNFDNSDDFIEVLDAASDFYKGVTSSGNILN